MVTFDLLRDMVLALPETEETTSWDARSFKVNGKVILYWNPTHDAPVFKVPVEERDFLIEADPETFFTTDHHRPHGAGAGAARQARPRVGARQHRAGLAGAGEAGDGQGLGRGARARLSSPLIEGRRRRSLCHARPAPKRRSRTVRSRSSPAASSGTPGTPRPAGEVVRLAGCEAFADDDHILVMDRRPHLEEATALLGQAGSCVGREDRQQRLALSGTAGEPADDVFPFAERGLAQPGLRRTSLHSIGRTGVVTPVPGALCHRQAPARRSR